MTKELGLRHGVPSHVTFRTVLNNLNQGQLIDAFHQWIDSISPTHEVLAGDGKALGSTVTDSQGSTQNYRSVAGLFGQPTGLVNRVANYQNAEKGQGEGNVMRELIKRSKGKDP